LKIFIGADHRGVRFKVKIKNILHKLHCDVVDIGAYDEGKSCDYPKIAYKVAKQVAKRQNGRGILLCMSGIGQAMAANKVPGAYAALCYNVRSAKLSRQHNNSNILVLGAKFVRQKDLSKIIKIWLTTKFEGGRHQRRINQIKRIEKGKKLR
jgi:RpiB/LacA/LacB family sugar-phosphate isomerase